MSQGDGPPRCVRMHVCFLQDPRVDPVIAANRTCYLGMCPGRARAWRKHALRSPRPNTRHWLRSAFGTSSDGAPWGG